MTAIEKMKSRGIIPKVVLYARFSSDNICQGGLSDFQKINKCPDYQAKRHRQTVESLTVPF